GVRLVNSMGLTGIAYAGYDVGGFAGNASEHLFARWIQIGAFSPFFRGHSMINSRDSEPWAYGEEVEEISRNYINLRYKLMPYIYSLFKEASDTGMPIARSLAIDYTHDDKIYDGAFHNQYLFGPGIMVAPVESYKDLLKVYLPEGNWYELFTDQPFEGENVIVAECKIEQLPLFVKGSSIIIMYPEAGPNTVETSDTLEVHVYRGSQTGEFTIYEDDGTTYRHEQGDYYERTIRYEPDSNRIVFEQKKGSYKSGVENIDLYLHGFDLEALEVNGKSTHTENVDYKFVEPISNFDPVDNYNDERLKIKGLNKIAFKYIDDEIMITW
ncbi:MAG: glycoside hydrolase family 31 protein, partial [Fulvivirga sp.]|nr:glycoside hydrolase family 31 protein [Fulvivirga sp.]